MSVAVVPGSAPGWEVSRSVPREARGERGQQSQQLQHTVLPHRFEQGQRIQQIRGIARIRAALASLVHSARHELLSFDDPAASLGQGIPESFLRSDTSGCATEVPTTRVRRIAPRHGLRQLREPWRCLGEARVTESVPFRIIVADRSVAAVPLDLDPDDDGVLLIRDPVVVRALVRIHEVWWETGEDLARKARSSGPPPHLRPVLEAILAGLTDDAAATRLNMSGRTYSRRVGELMSVLGTTSRFRAGAEAARRGWI
ncbi:DNA-binding response regulator [Streptomyces sp. NPDC020875]|uniref:DNA-binding response regulator n=1 Tax=Streptomyces sp. NPDC020875 TaxID=3154898 RepID=UPI0033C151D3